MMTKILELNGHKYSREQFEGYTHRVKFEVDVVNQEYGTNIDIYTNNENINSVYNVISGLTTDKVLSLELIHWTTKEQDDLTAQLLEETLKDL